MSWNALVRGSWCFYHKTIAINMFDDFAMLVVISVSGQFHLERPSWYLRGMFAVLAVQFFVLKTQMNLIYNLGQFFKPHTYHIIQKSCKPHHKNTVRRSYIFNKYLFRFIYRWETQKPLDSFKVTVNEKRSKVFGENSGFLQSIHTL